MFACQQTSTHEKYPLPTLRKHNYRLNDRFGFEISNDCLYVE